MLALTGCGTSQDGFTPGTWTVEAWPESDEGSGKGKPGSHIQSTVKLSAEAASQSPAMVFTKHFSNWKNKKSNVKIEAGRIEGEFEQQGVDDIQRHTVPVSGAYSRDSFNITYTYKVFGMEMRQVVEGRLTDAASRSTN